MNNLKVIWGSDHKVGTTMLAQSYAEISSENNNNILLLTLSTNPGDDFYDFNTQDLGALKDRLSCRALTKDNIKDYAIRGEKFYKINGLYNSKLMYEFTPTMTIDLINIALETFNEVVIDCGTGLDNPLALTALSYSKNCYFVFTQQESSIRSWNRMSDKLSELKIVPKAAIINKFFKGDNYTQAYISQRTGLPQSIFHPVSESEFGNQAEADRKTLLFYGDKQFEKDIRTLS